MSAQEQYAKILNYIGTDEIKNLFINPYSHKDKNPIVSMQYQRSDSLLSIICDNTMFGLLDWTDDLKYNYVMRQMGKRRQKMQCPPRIRVAESVTFLLIILPFVVMFLDFYFSWTSLSVFTYLYASACGAVLHATAKVAKKEWMDRKRNG